MRSDVMRAHVGSAALALALVLGAHVLLVWLLSQVITPSRSAAVQPRRVELRLILPPVLPPSAEAPPPPDRAGARSATAHTITRPRTVPRDEPALSPAPTDAQVQIEATAPSPPLSSPPSLLDTEATRRAIRASARMPSLVSEAARVTEEPRRANAQEQLGNAVREAGKGDCDKGEFAGAGMGLLSLPFLAAAAIRGDCAK